MSGTRAVARRPSARIACYGKNSDHFFELMLGAMMPRNATGKILRRQLREPYWEGRERQIN